MSPDNTALVHDSKFLESMSCLAVDSCTVIETDGMHESSNMDTLPSASSMQTLYLMRLEESTILTRNISDKSVGNVSELTESMLLSIMVSMLDQ